MHILLSLPVHSRLLHFVVGTLMTNQGPLLRSWTVPSSILQIHSPRATCQRSRLQNQLVSTFFALGAFVQLALRCPVLPQRKQIGAARFPFPEPAGLSGRAHCGRGGGGGLAFGLALAFGRGGPLGFFPYFCLWVFSFLLVVQSELEV